MNEGGFLIDEQNHYELLGHDLIVKLSTEFYTRVYSDTEQWFVNIFPKGGKEAAIQNQYEFFIQRLGGPNLYSQRKGHPALRARHARFPISPKAADRWLLHMNAAIEAVGIPPESAKALRQFFTHTAHFLENTDDE